MNQYAQDCRTGRGFAEEIIRSGNPATAPHAARRILQEHGFGGHFIGFMTRMAAGAMEDARDRF